MALLLQKKKEIYRKAIRAMVSAVCLSSLVLMATGCGKVEEPIPVQLFSGNVEELQNDTAGEIEDDAEKETAGDVNYDPEDVSAGTTKIDADDDMNESAGNGSENNVAQKDIQQSEDTQPNSVGNAELDGNVRSIGADSFVAARAETWSEGDAKYMTASAPGYEDEEDLITVHVDPNCVWEFKTVKNGGINPEDVSSREGSFADLKEGIAINSKGSWQADGSFLADSIVMMLFV